MGTAQETAPALTKTLPPLQRSPLEFLVSLSPGGMWGATSYELMGPGPPVQALLLDISIEEPWVAIIVEK
jgi:hypothetical protein